MNNQNIFTTIKIFFFFDAKLKARVNVFVSVKFKCIMMFLSGPLLCPSEIKGDNIGFYCMTSSHLIKILQSDWSVAMQ